MRIKIDDAYLNSIKQKLIHTLQLNSEIIERINAGSSTLYVENLKETQDAMMMSRKNEIAVDKEWVLFDDNGNVIGFNPKYSKFVESQLGHELLHAASKDSNYSGINKLSENNNRGLNEGITQMFTEDVFGYTVSRFSDSYNDYKRMAKIMRLCVGNEPFRSSYFGHTDKLKESCDNLSGDANFFIEFNRALTDLYYLRKVRGNDSIQFNLIQTIYYQRVNACYINLIINLVIPRLQKFKYDQEARAFINAILKVTEDNSEVQKMIVDILKDTIQLNNQQLLEEKNKTKLYDEIQKQKFNIFNLINQNKITAPEFFIDAQGMISYKSDSNKCVKIEEDEQLYAFIYDFLFDNHYGKNIDMNIYMEKVKQDKKIFFPPKANNKFKRILFSRLKKIANQNDITILNSYHECDNVDSMDVALVNKETKYDDLKNYIKKYELKIKNEESFNGEYIVVDKFTNKIVKNEEICTNVKFAYLWLSTKRHQYVYDEIPGMTDAFSEDNKELYDELINFMINNVHNTGNIDLDKLYSYAENHRHSRMEKIVSKIFQNPLSYEWVYAFVKQRIGKPTLQTEKEKSYIEQTNSKYNSSMANFFAEEIISSSRKR